MTLPGAGTIGALEPTTPMANYGRQSWVMENGLPQNTVHALAQTRDGFLWLGTEAGLVRFDGYNFAVFDRGSSPALPSGDIRCLLASADGSLWIGTGDGLARWTSDGEITSFTTRNGLPANGIRSLAQDPSGMIWAWTDLGLAGLHGDNFARKTEGLQGGEIAALMENNGQVWASTAQGLFLRERERWAPTESYSTPNPIEFVQSMPDRELALATANELLLVRGNRVVQQLRTGKEIRGTRIQALLADRKGSLWIGTNSGLARLVNGKIEVLPVTDPLSSSSVLALLADREGNLWAGTETGGLHILRDMRFEYVDSRQGLSSDHTTTVVEDRAGTLWVGTNGGGLNVVTQGPSGMRTTKTYTVREGLLSNVILSLGAAQNGDMWVGTPDGLNLIRSGRISSFTSADGLPDDFARSLLVDRDGSLWVGTRRGLTHWGDAPAGKHMETFTHTDGLGSDLVGSMARDSKGTLWVATLAGLSRIDGKKILNYTTANGLSSNIVTALLPRMGKLLIGTQDHGWNLWDGEKFTRPGNAQLNETSIHAILDDSGNHLWFATDNGIARCDCTMSAACNNWIEFGPADGLHSRETATNSHPSAWRSRDGRLWFATSKGLAEADPSHFPINMVSPPVALERFAVDDVNQVLGQGTRSALEVDAGHVHFEFDYAGLSYVAPQKVRYRYFLEGFDHRWTEAGARRTAYYTNIPPGHYTFHVQAANNDGLWNMQGAEFQFVLKPHFYQTLWFYILLTAFVAGMIVLLLRLRLLRAEREFGAVLAERTRIAREIHDTLAQGYVGISVQLEVLSELLRNNKVTAAQQQLDRTRGHVREGLADARQSIWALRSQDSDEKTMPVRLQRITENAGGHGLEASFAAHGAYRPLPPGTEREFLRIAQEAIHNVKKHAEAKRLSVQLDYSQNEIALEVRDDGKGFAVDQVRDNTTGHYGMTGMRERAAAIGGVLEVTAAQGTGTTVRLRAPAPKEAKE